jgi:hypothetical protein
MTTIDAQNIEPKWAFNFGSHSHTSRDEMRHILRDSQGNTIVVGFVERDSTFSDIMVQKYSNSGQILWQCRYSSGRALDYDTPQKAILDSEGHLYVLGAYANNTNYFYGGTFLLRIGPDGLLRHAYMLSDFVPSDNGISTLYMHIDPDKRIRVSFTTLTNKKTYQIVLRSDDTWRLGYQGYPLNELLASGNLGVHLTHSHNGDDIYLLGKEASSGGYTFFLRRAGDTINRQIDIDFSSSQKAYFNTYRMRLVQTDKDGNIYTIADKAGSPELLKINGFTGQVNAFSFLGNNITGVATGIQWRKKDSTFVILGKYGADEAAFAIEIDSTFRVKQKRKWAAPIAGYPVDLYESDGHFYTATDKNYIVELTDSLLPARQIAVNYPTNENFNRIGVVRGGHDEIIVGSTIYNRKYPTNSYLSENDFHLVAFDSIGQQKWQNRYSDEGTSWVLGQNLLVNPKNNEAIVIASEQIGPAIAGGSSGLVKTFLTKIDSSGHNVWRKDAPIPFSKFFCFDTLGNFFVLNGNSIFKMSPKGDFIKAMTFSSPPQFLFLDVYRNEMYYNTSGYDDNLMRLSSDLTLISNQTISGTIMKLFQKPRDSTIYYYSIKTVPEGNVTLWANGRVLWTKPSNIAQYQIYTTGFNTRASVQESSGDLAFLANSSIYYYPFRDGLLRQSQPTSSTPRSLFLMPNGNIIVDIANNYFSVYSNDLTYLNDTYFSSKFNTVYERRGQFLFKLNIGFLYIFDQNGEQLADYAHSSFYSGIGAYSWGKGYSFFSCNRVNEKIFPLDSGVSQAYGYRTASGIIADFDFLDILRSYITPVQTIVNKEGLSFNIAPNLITHKATLRFSDDFLFVNASSIQIHNLVGDIVSNIPFHGLKEQILDLQDLSEGFYFIQILDKNQNRLSKSVKILKL